MKNSILNLSFQIENTEITLLFMVPNMFQSVENISRQKTISLCHSHPVHEMFVVLEGSMVFTDNVQDISLKTRDICIVPPNLFHTTYVPADCDENTKRLSIFFIYKKLKNVNAKFDFYSMMNLLSKDNTNPKVSHISESFASILLEVLKEAGSGEVSAIDEVQTKNILSLIFINLLKNQPPCSEETSERYTRSADYYNRLVAINEKLNSKTGTIFSVNEIAKELEVTPRHLNNIFNDEYGTSVKNYSYTLRMRQAAFLLSYFPDLSIGFIAQNLGYATSEIFSIMFRRYFGISATQYRKKHKHKCSSLTKLPPPPEKFDI